MTNVIILNVTGTLEIVFVLKNAYLIYLKIKFVMMLVIMRNAIGIIKNASVVMTVSLTY